eukprot:351398-Chlamydomonas_euryale.AAC.8
MHTCQKSSYHAREGRTCDAETQAPSEPAYLKLQFLLDVGDVRAGATRTCMQKLIVLLCGYTEHAALDSINQQAHHLLRRHDPRRSKRRQV